MKPRLYPALALAAALLMIFGTAACGKGSAPQPAQQLGAAPVPPDPSGPAGAPLRAGERFQSIAMPSPYTPVPPHGGTDEYRCFLVDPHITSPMYLTGALFLPQNPAVVHHAIIFRVLPSDLSTARSLDAKDPGEGWTCFGGTGVHGAQVSANDGWVTGWAPGAGETVFNAEVGYKVDPGTQLILQVHYNLLATGGKAAGTDQSGVRLRLVDGGAKLDPLQTMLVAAPIELPCPAGQSGPLCDRNAAIADLTSRFGQPAQQAVSGLNFLCNGGRTPVAGNTQHCDEKVRQAGVIYAVAGHMHLLGKSITVELNPGTPQAQMLLNQPVYNFDNQSAYTLPTPVAVKPGDTVRVTCTHDATLRTKLPSLQSLPPRYVVWGDGTSDEMCLGILSIGPTA